MIKVPYLNYSVLKEFYTVEELCRLFGTSRSELTDKCKQYDIALGYNAHRELGLPRGTVKNLHYRLYHEVRDSYQRSNRRAGI